MKQRSLLVLIISAMYEENWAKPNLNPSYVPFMSYVLLESKAQIMAQFKSTLLDLHALFQVFMISLAYVKNVRSPLNLWSSNGRSFWIFFIIDLVIGPFNGFGLGFGLEGEIGLGGVTSSPPSWRGFALKSWLSSSSATVLVKGTKSVILKVRCTPYSTRRSN